MNARHRAHQNGDYFMNRVDEQSFLTLHYRLSSLEGEDYINTFADKPATLSMGTGELSAALETRLMGMPEGAHEVIETEPGEAFGPHNPELVQWVARSLIDQLGGAEQIYTVGDVVQFPAPQGDRNIAGMLIAVSDDGQSLQFDFNHPLAGRPVRFEVQLIGVL